MAEDTGLLSSNVSAGDDGLASQYNNLRADTKKMRQEEMTAGATIAGATLPVPVYQNTTDNEVYACDADQAATIEFFGFAISDGTDGNAIIVQHTGIVGGFTGLDEGEKYYVQDTAGTIGKTPGTTKILVGRSISSTELLILNEEKAIFKNGTTTKDAADASGTQNIAHGLGRIPRKIRINALLEDGSYSNNAQTIYNGTTQSSIFVRHNAGTPYQGQLFELGLGSDVHHARGIVTFDATNIIITWTKTNTPTGTYNLLWEAEA